MAKKTCPNGHIYDPNIYGDQCPLCPVGVSASASSTPATQIGGMPAPAAAPAAQPHTHIAGGGAAAPAANPANAHGPTMMRPGMAPMAQTPPAAPAGGGHTVIRPAGGAAAKGTPAGRRLVGFLVTYNRDPNGRAYNIYEGRNYIGRDANNDIAVTDDDQMSGRHMSILYRAVDDKFKFRDEQSSNGTFVNKELLDAGELENFDIVRAGNTLFIFMAIPKLF